MRCHGEQQEQLLSGDCAQRTEGASIVRAKPCPRLTAPYAIASREEEFVSGSNVLLHARLRPCVGCSQKMFSKELPLSCSVSPGIDKHENQVLRLPRDAGTFPIDHALHQLFAVGYSPSGDPHYPYLNDSCWHAFAQHIGRSHCRIGFCACDRFGRYHA